MSKSTVSRELRRNGGSGGSYNFIKAHGCAMSRRHRLPGNRTKTPELLWRVRQLILEQQCSPRQISGYLREKEGFGISHEAIYKMVRADENGTLAVACRHWMKYRRRPSHSQQTKATNIRGHVSIHERPEEADGTRFGDRVMDLIVDARQNTILTLTERSTHFLLMTRLEKGKKASQVARQAYRLLMPYKGEMMHAITTDNSSEFAQHQWIARRLGVKVCFTGSYASWQKGAVENINKLVRQYYKKVRTSAISQKRELR